jgi:thiamine-phosphate diphosphorylase
MLTSTELPVLHAVTSDEIVADPEFVDRARRVMGALGPAGAVHLRAHHTAGRRVYEAAAALAAEQVATGCWLVVNDRVDVAMAAGARGVQLTSRSLRVVEARRLAPGLAVGASIHSLADAREAELSGATWCVAGHIYPTRSHPGEAPRGLGLLEEIARAIRVAVIAIGGVRPEHLPALRAAGAYGAAVIRGIWHAAYPERAATDYLSRYDGHASRS